MPKASVLALGALLDNLSDQNDNCDRIAWYIAKLAFSAEALKDICNTKGSQHHECKAQLHRFVNTVKEVDERLGLAGQLVKLAETAIEYAKQPSKDARVKLNEAVKVMIRRILRVVASLGRCP